jgi:hypothetical protein
MKIKVMPFLTRKGNRVAKAAIEFQDETDGLMKGCQLVGFTICDDTEKGLYVMFPSSITKREQGDTKLYFFLRPVVDGFLGRLENAILDTYESMVAFNGPRMVTTKVSSDTVSR